MEPMETLFKTLTSRKRPEDIAQMILDLRGVRLSDSERRILEKAAKGSLQRNALAYTSMLQDFARPVGLERQATKAQELFISAAHWPLDPAAMNDPIAVETFIRGISPEIHKFFGANDFKSDRLNREARSEAGMEISRRRYNKLFRHLTRMEDKLRRLIQEIKKYELTLIGKSGLASRLSYEQFASEEDAACFIAYYVARCNLRSEFTVSGQQRPYDDIAYTLFARCLRNETTNWLAIAHVYPEPVVFAKVGDVAKGQLLGEWFATLQEAAAQLQSLWDQSPMDRQNMIVRRGNDSTTWNNTANAWNKARDNWIGLLYALGMDAALDAICPGKALRLMAADVVAWHLASGGGLDKNTLVWRDLPLPWEILAGQAECDRNTIAAVCLRHSIDPVKSGWAGPKPTGNVAPFRPTPELVHGVTVANPFLATVLKKHGFFSGKGLK